MVTIGDVAREAGVSRSTASYALSGKRSISEEVRHRVEVRRRNALRPSDSVTRRMSYPRSRATLDTPCMYCIMAGANSSS